MTPELKKVLKEFFYETELFYASLAMYKQAQKSKEMGEKLDDES